MTDVVAALRTERLAIVERLSALDDAQWSTPSLCDGWTVRDVLAHLLVPVAASVPRVAAAVLRHRGIGAAMVDVTREMAERDTDELLRLLEQGAGSTTHPPGLPLAAPLSDVVVHGSDIRWPLGDAHDDWGDPERLRAPLTFLVGRRSVVGFVPRGRLAGLRFEADDLAWSHGDGPLVRGAGLHLAMGMLGRRVALPHLRGEGVDVLERRL